MEHIKVLYNVLLVLIPIGAAARILYCLMARAADDEEARSYNVRIRNVLIFTVAAESIVALLRWTGSYF